MEPAEIQSILLTDLQGKPQLTAYLRGHMSVVNHIAFSPDGQLLASAGMDGKVILRQVDAQGATIHQPFQTPDLSYILNVAFSPNGQLRAAAGSLNTVIVWDISTGAIVHRFVGTAALSIRAIAFSPNGKLLAVEDGNDVSLWDVASAKLVRQLKGHKGLVNALEFDPDAPLLASGGDDGNIFFWNLDDGTHITFPMYNSVQAIAFNPQGSLLAGSTDAHSPAFQERVANYEHALLLHADNAILWAALESAYANTANYTRSTADFTHALQLYPQFGQAYAGRGTVYLQLGLYPPAADYTNSLQSMADNTNILINRGLAYQYANQLTEALADYNRAIELNANDSVALALRAYLYLYQGDYQRALADLNRSIQISDSWASVFDNRAWVYYLLGDDDKVLADSNQAIALEPQTDTLYVDRAVVYWHLGKSDLAF